MVEMFRCLDKTTIPYCSSPHEQLGQGQRTRRTFVTPISHPAPPAAHPNVFLFRQQSAALPRASYRR